MATLKNSQSQQTIVLRGHHIIGRHPQTSHTLISDSTISRSHCLIDWHNHQWYVQDISANGTYINGKRIAKNIKYPLKQDDQIQFGDIALSPWQVIDLTAPSAFLQSCSPNIDDLLVSNKVTLLEQGGTEFLLSQTLAGQWLFESDGHIKALEHQQKVTIANHDFIFVCSDDIEATQQHSAADNSKVILQFNVSQNEEHIALELDIDGMKVDLAERTHHYLLLLLARQYLEDKRNNIVDSEAGWLDKSLLMKQTRMEETHINTQFFRFKKQLHNALKGSNLDINVIERRRGEIRVQCDQIIIKDAKVA